MTTKLIKYQESLIPELCPMCLKLETEVGELHEDDGLCAACEGEWVDFTQEMAT